VIYFESGSFPSEIFLQMTLSKGNFEIKNSNVKWAEKYIPRNYVTSIVRLWQCALLERIQREDEREEHENRHSGRYRRIFPPVDRLTRIRYANLLANAYRTFLSGRQNQNLDLEIQRLYSCDLKVLTQPVSPIGSFNCIRQVAPIHTSVMYHVCVGHDHGLCKND